jgi:hypothetical protein
MTINPAPDALHCLTLRLSSPLIAVGLLTHHLIRCWRVRYLYGALLSLRLVWCGWRRPELSIPLAIPSALSYILYRGNGIHDTAVTFFPLVIVFAALLLGKRGTLIFGFLSIVSVAWIIHAEVRGGLVTGFGNVTGYSDVVTIGVMLGVTTLMLWVP